MRVLESIHEVIYVLIDVAVAIAEYFYIAKNRDIIFTLIAQLLQKLLDVLSNQQSHQIPQSLPKKSSVESGKINQPWPSNPSLKPPAHSPTAQPSQLQIIKPSANQAKPVQLSSQTLAGASFYLTTIDLTDPEHYITIGLANNAILANNSKVTAGDEHG